MAGYVSASEIRSVMPDAAWGTAYDAALETLAERASRLVDRYLHRAPGAFAAATDTTRSYVGTGELAVWIDELAAAPTSVEIERLAQSGVYDEVDSDNYSMWPENALEEGMPYTRINMNLYSSTILFWPATTQKIRIVGKFGFSTTAPEEIKQAVTIQTVRWLKRGQNSFADSAAVPELQMIRHTSRLDPEVEEILSLPHLQRVVV